jgi:ribosome-associated toxin RatA of RatAB toxin-antitoxin module
MPVIQRSALVPHSAMQMFELVNDVERYPEFLPWCSGARVVAQSGDAQDAMLTIVSGRWHEQFTTRNVADPPRGIHMRLLNGPFRRLEGQWQFVELADAGGIDGCRVALTLDFEMARPLLGHAFGGVVSRTASAIVDAFCARARAFNGSNV